MAEFVAFNEEVEVNKQTVMSIVNSMENGRNTRLNILIQHGIDPDEAEWFNQQNWLDAFETIADELGDSNLFLIGRAIIENAQFPPINDLREGLEVIDVAYHMNHRLNDAVMFDPTTGTKTDGIGHYTLTSFDASKREAIMVCNNPYPSKFDEGIIAEIAKKFKPSGATEKVKLDTTKESRKDGGESCTYIITW